MDAETEPTDAGYRADALKERVYVTFTALAVVLAMQTHAEGLTAGEAAKTIAITVIGTLLAVFVADLVANLAVHTVLPTRPELRRMMRVSFGAFAVAVLPLIFIGFAALGSWQIGAALQASTIALTASLILIGYLAVRRAKLTWWQRLIALGAEFLLGLAVVALELLAHG